MPRGRQQHRYHVPKRSCQGKVQHQSQHEAEAAAEENMIIHPEVSLSVYKCLSCSGWHLTSVKD